MKRPGKNIGSLILVLLWLGFILTAATPGFGAEPDEEKLLNRLKSELAEEDSTMGKLLDRFSFGLLIEAGAAYRNVNEDGEDESDKIENLVAGWATYFSAGWGILFLEAEYMAALDDFEAAELSTKNGDGAEPAVWNIEAGFNYDWWRNLEVAFKYAGSDEAEGLGIPQIRYGVALNQEIFDNTIFSMGYLHDTFDDDLLDNGTEDERHSLFTQIAVEF
jgi:hypothetical protein